MAMAASRLLYATTTTGVSTPKLISYANTNNGRKLRIRRALRLRCKALGDGTVYQGVYGPWTVDPSDVQEVILYRSGLVTAATSFVVAASAAFWPQDSNIGTFIENHLDSFYLIGGAGLGVSLVLIHIYVTQIKRTLQALWGLGALGSLLTYTSLAAPAGEGLVQYVVHNPTAVWFVGPLFAALTGLVFKEGKSILSNLYIVFTSFFLLLSFNIGNSS